MQSRFLKQLIYGVFYLVILFGIGYLFYIGFLSGPASCFDNRRNQGEIEVDCGGPCESCDIKRLQPIRVMPIELFSDQDGTVSALIELRNPNVAYGAENFSYTLKIYDSGKNLLGETSEDSFIYPGEIKFIVEANLPVSGAPKSAEFETKSFSWRKASEFSAPKTQTRDIKIGVQDGRVVVSGFLVNQNSYALREAAIHAVILDEFGKPVGISKTLVQNIEPFGERSWSVGVPNISTFESDQVSAKIFVEARK